MKLRAETFGKLSSHFWEQIELPLFLNKIGNPLLLNLCNTAPLFYSNKIVCIHDLAVLVNPQWFSKSFAAVYKIILPKIAKNSKKILTVSNFSKESLQTILRLNEKDIAVIYNAVSDSFAANNLISISRSYGRYILAVSSIEPRKNLKNLIIGFKQAKQSGLQLVIVGAGSKVFNDPGLKELVQGEEDIFFTGYLPDADLVSIYSKAFMFVYPSLYEGFGIPPLEAMHCGCPTIVSGTSSLPEVCGEASYFVDPEKPEEIAEAIRLLLGDEEIRNSLIRKGYVRAKEFNWKDSAEKLAGIINNYK